MGALLKLQTALPTGGPAGAGWGQGPAHPLDFKVSLTHWKPFCGGDTWPPPCALAWI